MKFFSIIISAIALSVPSIANASSLARVCSATGNCGLCDIVATAVTVGQWLIAGAAGFALVLVVWGAFGLIAAAGNPEKIGANKKLIVGAFFGLAIVMLSFQIVAWLILGLATPSDYITSEKTAENHVQESTSLTGLLGMAWWDICDEKALREANGAAPKSNTTADCKFWGDGTPCNKDNTKICISGECVKANSDKVKKHFTKFGIGAKKSITNACDYLSAMDMTYKDYECRNNSECDKATIEKGFCPGDKVCCKKKP